MNRHRLAWGLGVALALGLAIGGLNVGGIAPIVPTADAGTTPGFVFLATLPANASQCGSSAVIASDDGGLGTYLHTGWTGCVRADQTQVQLPTAIPPITSTGVLLEMGFKSETKWSEAFDKVTGGWALENGSILQDQVTAPDGTLTGDMFTDSIASGGHSVRQQIGGTDGTGQYPSSIFVKAGTLPFTRFEVGQTAGDTAIDMSLCRCSKNSLAATYGAACTLTGIVTTVENAGGGWCHLSLAKSDSDPGAVRIYGCTNATTCATGYIGNDAGTFYVWGAMRQNLMVPPYALSYHQSPDAGQPYTDAGSLNFPSHLVDADTSWTFRAKVRPNWNIWTKGEVRQGVWLLGATYQGADTASLLVDSRGKVVFEVVDHASAVKTFTSGKTLSKGQHNLRVVNAAGALSVYDGPFAMAGSTSGAGTGQITTMPSTMFLGSLGAVIDTLDGTMMDVCLVNSAGDCLPDALSPLSFASAGGFAFTNGFLPDEPVWCVRETAPASGYGVMASAGTPGTANSWVFYADGGSLQSRIWDMNGELRTRGTSVWMDGGLAPDGGSAHDARLCDIGGEESFDFDGIPCQVDVYQDAGLSFIGNGLVRVQPATVSLSSAAGCISRSQVACGTRHHYLATFGDSLTWGPSVTRQWPDIIDDALPNDWEVRNYAIGGLQLQQMHERWRELAKESQQWDAVSVMCCTNDMLGSATHTATWTGLENWYNEIRDGGAQVIPIIATQFKWEGNGNWTAGKQTQADLLRQDQLNFCADGGITCIDPYAWSGGGDGGDSAVLSPLYNIATHDNIHLNDLEQALIADAGLSTLIH